MLKYPSTIIPIVYDRDQVPGYGLTLTSAFRAALLWNKYAPRGKGAIPRLLGRTIAKNIKQSIMTSGGAQLAVLPACLDIYVSIYNQGGTWNTHVFETCASLLHSGNVFWDIGANVGFMSIEMACRFHDDLHVSAFEPQPALSKNIFISAALNNFRHVNVFDVMLGSADGEAMLYVGSHAIHASAIPRERSSTHVRRQITTIDHLMESGNITAPHVIKMDIEGGELAALSGAQRMISKYKPHIVFESDDNMIRFGYQRKDVLQQLSEYAPYEFYFIAENCALIPIHSSNIDAPYSDILAKVVA